MRKEHGCYMKINLPENHPRYHSIVVREILIEACEKHVLTPAGLIAQGRGEAFDYFIGETTRDFALKAVEAAAASLLIAKKSVISVNGNAAALVASGIVELGSASGALIEVNLFYRSKKREKAVEKVLKKAGAHPVLGVGRSASAKIEELSSDRRKVDPRGIGIADTVLVPLEDGDRTEALVRLNKTVITIDLNPLSRTAQAATITIVDNITRAIPLLVKNVNELKTKTPDELRRIVKEYDNKKTLAASIDFMSQRLKEMAGR
jgi:4-phosphopantoate--beta-alanine ligase